MKFYKMSTRITFTLALSFLCFFTAIGQTYPPVERYPKAAKVSHSKKFMIFDEAYTKAVAIKDDRMLSLVQAPFLNVNSMIMFKERSTAPSFHFGVQDLTKNLGISEEQFMDSLQVDFFAFGSNHFRFVVANSSLVDENQILITDLKYDSEQQAYKMHPQGWVKKNKGLNTKPTLTGIITIDEKEGHGLLQFNATQDSVFLHMEDGKEEWKVVSAFALSEDKNKWQKGANVLPKGIELYDVLSNGKNLLFFRQVNQIWVLDLNTSMVYNVAGSQKGEEHSSNPAAHEYEMPSLVGWQNNGTILVAAKGSRRTVWTELMVEQ